MSELNLKGINALRQNIDPLIKVGDIVGSTIGPQGKDVEIINKVGKTIFSNDGATVLKNINIDDPIISKCLIHSATNQEKQAGDGTSTMVLYASELSANGYNLNFRYNIDPVVISKGYKLALDKSIETLNKYSIPLKIKDIKGIVKTTFTGKSLENYEFIHDLCIKAVKESNLDLSNIIVKGIMGDLNKTKSIRGIALDASLAHNNMPKALKNPKILILDAEVGEQVLRANSHININNIEELTALQDRDSIISEKFTKQIKSLGVDILICQRDISDFAIEYLNKAKIVAIRNINDKETIEQIARALACNIVKDIKNISKEDLGTADSYKYSNLTDEGYLIFEKAKSEVQTILVYGSNEMSIDEYKRAIDDAIGTIKTILEHKTYVLGAGNIEIRIAEELRAYSKTLNDGLLEASVNAFADSIEIVPIRLAISAGMHPLKALNKLRKNKLFGVNVHSGEIERTNKVIEPTYTKQCALTNACEVVINNVLRIGYIIEGRNE